MADLYKTEPAPIKPTVLRYALIGSLLLIAFSLISQIMGLNTHSSWTVRTLSSLVSIVIIFLVFRSAIISYRDHENDGLVTLGKGFMITFWITLIMAAASAIFFIIMATYIDPTIPDMALEESIANMEARGMSEDEMEVAMPYVEALASKTGLTITVFLFTAILGAILGLVTALIYKKEVPGKV